MKDFLTKFASGKSLIVLAAIAIIGLAAFGGLLEGLF